MGLAVGAVPAAVAAAGAGENDGPLCIDLDATLVIAHSDDQDGANTATDQIRVLDRAIAQLLGAMVFDVAGA